MIAPVAPVTAVANGKAMWYLTRGSGIVALLLVTASVVLGILTSGRWEALRWPRFVIERLHRNISLLVVVFIAIHVATTVVDGFVPIGWLDAIIPFRSGYRPVWVGLGTLAVDLLLAITITSLLRVRIGHRTWRVVHLLSYAMWPTAVIHGLGSGTDAAATWMVGLTGASLAAVAIALWWRLAVRRPRHVGVAPVAVLASLAVPMAIGAFAWTGPLRAGWGSHGARLGGSAAPAAGSAAAGSAAAATSTTAPSAGVSLPVRASITGQRTVADQGDQRVVTLSARTTAAPALDVTITLYGAADPSGGVSLQRGTIAVGPAGGRPQWQGAVTGLRGSTVAGTLSGPGGARAAFAADLVLDRRTSALQGSVTITAQGSGGRGTDGSRSGEGGEGRTGEGSD